MALQPTRRQKRPIVLSSDNEEDVLPSGQCLSQTTSRSSGQVKSKRINDDSISSQPVSKRPRPKTRSATLKSRSATLTQLTQRASLEHSSRTSIACKSEKSQSLHAYFNAADFIRPEVVSRIDEAEVGQTEEEEDVIEDDVSEGEFSGPSNLRNTTRFVLDRRKQPAVSSPRGLDPSHSSKHHKSSQIFAIPQKILSDQSSQRGPSVANNGDDDPRPWAEKYGPASLQELMVHKQKIADVRNWIEKFWKDGNQRRLLVLKGPAGAGKTATVMAVAKALDIHVVEWVNPKESRFSSAGHLSMSAQFEDFLGRSSKFGTLEFVRTASGGNDKSAIEGPISDSSKKKLILLEEFPNTLTSTSAAAISFQTSLLHYLAANPPSSTHLSHSKLCRNQAPVVMIITECHLTGGTSSEDNFSAHRLLGPDILGHPSVSVIEFNTMAPTYVVKALELVMRKEARQSGRQRIPGLPLLKKLAETGDIRSAIAALEFICLRKADGDDWSGRVASKGKTKNSSSALTKSERDSLEKITRREASLGIFHAVGKVVYNKREEIPDATLPTDPPRALQPPDYMSQHTRRRTSLVSPDELIDLTGTDRPTFVAALHENYVTSCEGVSFIDSLNGCLDALSDTDILGSERSGRIGPSGLSGPQRGASDSLRQDEIGFHLAVRGILFALPFPVKRSPSLSSGRGRGGEKGDAYKMFYPASVKLRKETEEVKSLVDRWAERYGAGVLPPERSFDTLRYGATIVQGRGARSTKAGAVSDIDGNRLPGEADLLCPSSNASRVELILETLPYLAHIERCRARSLRLRELEPIIGFPSLNPPSHEGRGNDDGCLGLDRDGDAARAQWSSMKPRRKGRRESLSEDADIGKLWLSDDEIEDD